MPLNIPLILDSVLEGYALPWGGCHGIAHWVRVMENGLQLAGETGADVEVVRLFALLHDSRRISEGDDPGHGPRAALFAGALRGRAFALDDAAFLLLHRACAGHTHERTHPDVTIRTCWDSDRLDLGRVGVTPDPAYLGTEAARRPAMIRWADARATFLVAPKWLKSRWGVDPDGRGEGIRRAGRI